MILVRSQSWGKFHVVISRDDHSAACGREASSVGAFSHSLAPGNEGLALSEAWVCQHCLNQLQYRHTRVMPGYAGVLDEESAKAKSPITSIEPVRAVA